MVELTTQEIEELVNLVEDPTQKIKIGLEVSQKLRENTSLANYSRQCLEATIEGALEEQERDAFSHRESNDLETLLNRLPKDEARSMALRYVRKRFETLSDNISHENDSKALKLAELARKYGITAETSEQALEYAKNRVTLARNPESLKDTKIEYGFSKLMEIYGIDTSEVKRLNLIQQILYPSGFPSDKNKIPEDQLEGIVKEAWETAITIRKKSGKEENLGGMIRNEEFKRFYADDDEARQIAVDVIGETLKRASWNYLEDARDIRTAYGIDNLDSQVREAMLHNIEQGRFETLDNICSEFGYEPSEEDFTTARSNLMQKIKERINSSPRMSRDVEEIVNLRRRLKALDLYVENGLDVNLVPQVVLPEGFNGKMILSEFKDRYFVRVDTSNRGIHRNIADNFAEELRTYGFEELPEVRGGAYISFDEEGKIHITDKSGDYGECDKDKAKELVSSAFPDREVVSKPVSVNGW